MILRKLAEAIRNQSWSIVVLEILILVVGIFIGLQVDDWSKYRQDRRDEVHYLNRLHDELLNAEKLSARVLVRRIERQQIVFDIIKAVFNDNERQALTYAECDAIAGMHFFNIAVSGLSAAEELTASGRMGILRDTDLRAALGALKQTHDATNTYIRNQTELAQDLAHLYPELITLRSYFDEALQEVDSVVSCDLPAMRRNAAFLNDLSNNADVYDAYVRDAVSPWAEQMKRVHELLDNDLGIEHAAPEAER